MPHPLATNNTLSFWHPGIAPHNDHGTFRTKSIYLSIIFSCLPIGRCGEVVQELSTLWPAEQFLPGFWPMAASFGNSREPRSHPSPHHLLQLCQIPWIHGGQDPCPCIVRRNLYFVKYVWAKSPLKQSVIVSLFVAVMKIQTHTGLKCPECFRMTHHL